jgi:hypothetical protein
LQKLCVRWFNLAKPKLKYRLFAVTNNSVNRIKGAMDKALGVVAGVSDMVYVCDKVTVFIEFKVGADKQSDAQRAFMEKVRALGHVYVIVSTFEEFQQVVNAYE